VNIHDGVFPVDGDAVGRAVVHKDESGPGSALPMEGQSFSNVNCAYDVAVVDQKIIIVCDKLPKLRYSSTGPQNDRLKGEVKSLIAVALLCTMAPDKFRQMVEIDAEAGDAEALQTVSKDIYERFCQDWHQRLGEQL
jgi:hypothetical protein